MGSILAFQADIWTAIPPELLDKLNQRIVEGSGHALVIK
jgi:hypothetical protein